MNLSYPCDTVSKVPSLFFLNGVKKEEGEGMGWWSVNGDEGQNMNRLRGAGMSMPVIAAVVVPRRRSAGIPR